LKYNTVQAREKIIKQLNLSLQKNDVNSKLQNKKQQLSLDSLLYVASKF